MVGPVREALKALLPNEMPQLIDRDVPFRVRTNHIAQTPFSAYLN